MHFFNYYLCIYLCQTLTSNWKNKIWKTNKIKNNNFFKNKKHMGIYINKKKTYLYLILLELLFHFDIHLLFLKKFLLKNKKVFWIWQKKTRPIRLGSIPSCFFRKRSKEKFELSINLYLLLNFIKYMYLYFEISSFVKLSNNFEKMKNIRCFDTVYFIVFVNPSLSRNPLGRLLKEIIVIQQKQLC